MSKVSGKINCKVELVGEPRPPMHVTKLLMQAGFKQFIGKFMLPPTTATVDFAQRRMDMKAPCGAESSYDFSSLDFPLIQ